MKKRIFSMILALVMVLSILPLPVHAAEVCPNHPEHVGCSYAAEVPATCGHVHGAECYPDGNMEGEPSLCTHVCSEEAGCTLAVPAQPCNHSCELCQPAPEPQSQAVCTCETACAEGAVNGACPVCSAEWGKCAKIAPTCTCQVKCNEMVDQDCPVCDADPSGCQGAAVSKVSEKVLDVQARIDALPTLKEVQAMAGKTQAYTQTQAAYEAYLALTAEEQAQVTGAEIFESLLTYFTTLVNPTVEYVAEVNGTGYSTLDGAITAAGTNGTIKLLQDCEKSGTNYSSLNLDLNGHKINFTGELYAYTFTLSGEGSLAGMKVLYTILNASDDCVIEGDLINRGTIAGGKFTGTVTLDKNTQTGTYPKITGGTFDTVTVKNDSTIEGGNFGTITLTSGTLTIKGGYFANDPSDYVADGYEAVPADDSAYSYMVVKSPININSGNSSNCILACTYNGQNQVPTQMEWWRDNEEHRILYPDVDYTLTFTDPTAPHADAGWYNVTVYGKGNYTGSFVNQPIFHIKPIALTEDMITVADAFIGETPAVTVTVNGVQQTLDKDYTLTLAEDTVTVTPKNGGNLTGDSVSKSFNAVDPVASVTSGGVTTNYTSLLNALAAATAGDTVKLLADVNIENDTIDKDLTLDLGDHVLTVSGSLTINANVTINTGAGFIFKDSSGGYAPPVAVNAGGVLTATGSGLSCDVSNNGTISGGSFTGTVYCDNGSAITGGNFGYVEVVANASLTITGGTFGEKIEEATIPETHEWKQIDEYTWTVVPKPVAVGPFVVSGGTKDDYVWDDGKKSLTINTSAPLTISMATPGTTATGTYINYNAEANLTLDNVSIVAPGGYTSLYCRYGLNLTLVGTNSLKSSTAKTYGAFAKDAMTLGGSGTLTAEGGTAGIYGESSVSIEGGTVTATGGNVTTSYGIFGQSEITISGGTVTATGGQGTTSYGIATNSSIIISGGTGTATGSGNNGKAMLGYLTHNGVYATSGAWDGTAVRWVSVDTTVAQVGTSYYETVQAAIDACAEGGTVKLLKDVEEVIKLDKEIKIQINIDSNGNNRLTALEGSQISKGSIENASDDIALRTRNYGIISGGTFDCIINFGVVENGVFTSDYGLVNEESGIVNNCTAEGIMQNCGIINGGHYKSNVILYVESVINGGYFDGEVSKDPYSRGTIKDGYFKNDPTDYLAQGYGIAEIPESEYPFCVVHTAHTGTWSVNGDGDTLSFTCDTCKEELSAKLTAPEKAVYTGSAIEATVTTTGEWGIVEKPTVTHENNTNAGTAKATMTVGGKPVSVEFTIKKATPTVTAPTAANRVYDGTEQPLLTAGITNGGFFTYSLDGDNWSDTIPTATDVAEYTVYWKLDGGQNYESVDGGAVTVQIALSEAEFKDGVVLDHTDNTYTYGETVGVTVTVKATGMAPNPVAALFSLFSEPDDDNTVTIYNGNTPLDTQALGADNTATFSLSSADLGAGTHTLKASFTGNDNMGPYTQEFQVTVAKKEISFSLMPTGDAVTKEYDGTTGLTSGVTHVLDGILDADKQKTGVEISYAFNSAKAAEANTVTGAMKLTGDWDKNYVLKSNTATIPGTITPKPLTVKAKDQSIVEGTEIAKGTDQVTVTGLVTGETLTGIALTPSITAVGTGTVTPSAATISSGAENYDITYETGTLTVTAKTVPVTGVTLNEKLTLDEGEKETLNAIVAPADATNKKVTWKSSDPSVASVDASGTVTALKEGTATITVTTEDGGFTATCTLTVKKNYTVQFDPQGGTPDPKDQTVAKNGKVTEPTNPTKKDKNGKDMKFGGWFTDEKFTEEWDFDKDKVTEDITLHAQWLYTYKVDFRDNTSARVTNMPDDIEAQSPEGTLKIRIPANKPKRSGYSFAGWYKTSDHSGTRYNPGDDLTMDGNTQVTLYARWKEVDPTNAKTGDYILIAVTVLALSGAALAGLMVYGKKKKK